VTRAAARTHTLNSRRTLTSSLSPVLELPLGRAGWLYRTTEVDHRPVLTIHRSDLSLRIPATTETGVAR